LVTISDLFVDPRGYPFCDEEAKSFSAAYDRDLNRWWEEVQQADWMILVAAKCGIGVTRLIPGVCDCTRIGFRFVPDFAAELEGLLSIGERAARGEATEDECLRASDEASKIQECILEACSVPNTLAAARAAGAIATILPAIAFRHYPIDCLRRLLSTIKMVVAAGYYLDGVDSKPALQLLSAMAVRRHIRATELALPT
jgi:hypothetical protein